MKKFLVITMVLYFLFGNVLVFADNYGYVEIIQKSQIPTGTYIGDYKIEKGSTDNSIKVSNSKVEKTLLLEHYFSNYTVIKEGNIYLFIDQTQELIPDSEIMGANRHNSPIYFFDKDMNLMNKKEFEGYMKYEKYENNYFYFCFTDSSMRKFNDAIGGFEGDLITHYYKTNNGIDYVEITYDEFYENHSNKVEKKLCNGNRYYFDKNNNLYLQGKDTAKVLREPDNYNRYGATVNKGSILYKIMYDENEKEISQQLSIDSINYYNIPVDADLSNAKCDNEYLYCDIAGDDNRCYKISIAILESGVKVKYKESYLSFATSPTTESDRTLVSMRFLFEQMGAKVDWNGKTQTAIVQKDGNKIEFSIDKKTATVNGIQKEMDVPARLINNKTMIPLRFLSEELGYKVDWDENTRTATIID